MDWHRVMYQVVSRQAMPAQQGIHGILAAGCTGGDEDIYGGNRRENCGSDPGRFITVCASGPHSARC